MNIKEVLNEFYGYSEFRKGQEEIINEIVSGKNVLAILPTGAGKSVCYQIPAILGKSFSIIISPLVALMKDQVDSLNRKKVVSAFINSSIDYFESETILREVNEGKIKLLYLAPEKLLNSSFAEKIKNLKPEYIFVDEAHCISEWGHNFRPSYRKIIDFADYVGVKKISAFTATATPEVRTDIIDQLNLENPKVFVRGFERENLNLNVIKTKSKKEVIPDLIKKFGSPAIIYTATRKYAEETVEFLKLKKINAEFYHAGLSPEVRRIIQDDFLKDRLTVISATNAFGMGIDKKDIRLIIHYNMPGTIENYYQEIGRAGRDGKESYAFLLYEPRDKFIQEFFISNSLPTQEQIKFAYETICNINTVAVGAVSSKNLSVDEKCIRIFRENKISDSILQSSLRVLEEAEYLKIDSELGQKYSAKSMIAPAKLKNFITKNSNGLAKDILLLILREAGNKFFEQKVRLTVSKFASELNASQNEIIKSLDKLNNSGLIEFDKPSKFQTVKLVKPRVESKHLFFNYNKIEKQLENAESKLEKIIDYVKTPDCKFKYILEYFGEDVADYTCGKCENCRSVSYNTTSSSFIENKINEVLNSTQEKFTKRKLVDYLKGKNANQFEELEEHFGCCVRYSKKEIESSIENLIFSEEIDETNGCIVLNNFREDEEDISLPIKDKNYEERLELFNLLRIVRKEASQRFSQPVKLICSDELLREIAEYKPKNATEFLKLKGMNSRIFNKIGNEMISAVKDFEKILKEREISKNIPEELTSTLSLIEKQYSLEDIAALQKVSETIASAQIEALIQFNPELEIEFLFNKNELNLIEDEINKGIKNAKRLKEILPKDISYGKIKIALAKNNLN